jgi:hypothetical protein
LELDDRETFGGGDAVKEGLFWGRMLRHCGALWCFGLGA